MWRTSHQLSTRIRPSVQPGCVLRLARASESGAASTPASQPASKAEAPAPPQQPTQPPPPPPRKGGGAFWKLLGLTIVGAGGVVGYSWYDPKFRQQLETNVPYSKEALDYTFQYLPPTTTPEPKPSTIPALDKPIVSNVEEIQKLGKARVIKPGPVPEVPTAIEPVKPALSPKEKAAKEAEEKKQREQERILRRKQEIEADEAAENAALEVVLSSVVAEAVESARQSIEAQKAAADAIRLHSQKLKCAMDEPTQGNKEQEWEAVNIALDAKKVAEEKAEETTHQARAHIEKVKMALAEGKQNKVTKKNPVVRSSEQTLNQITYDLNKAEDLHKKAQGEAKVMEEYRSLVRKGKEQFKKELESIMPDVKMGKKIGGRLTEDELNSLIAHAHRRIEQLQLQLAEQQALETQRMAASIQLKEEEDNKVAESLVKRELAKQKAEFELDKEKWDTEAGVKFEKELRLQLSRQAAAHSDHLAQVLKVQEGELHRQFEMELQDRVIEARTKLHNEVEAWIARVKGIEAAVESRAELEKQGRKAQELWLACQTLVNIIQTGKEGAVEEWEDQLKPLEQELKAIQEAGNGHPFVNTVIESVPEAASKNGVWTEEALIARFHLVRRVGRRVAMVDEAGGTLFRYFLSYLQSLFVFAKARPLTDIEEIDPSGLNTFVLLDNAAMCLEKGDLEQAVRYVNQLRGQPRFVAADWLKDARMLLETKQAATALLSHASASGLGSLF